MQLDDKEKQASLDVAEDSRQTDWQEPSFVAELFQGNFAWGHIHPFPLQSAEDKKIGDDYIEVLRTVLEEHIDPSDVDRTGEVPQSGLDALAAVGAYGMKIPKEYGGLGLSQTNYSRACAFMSSYCASTAAGITAHQSIGVPQPLKLFGTKEQKEKFLPRIAKGAVTAFALTEPQAGSDAEHPERGHEYEARHDAGDEHAPAGNDGHEVLSGEPLEGLSDRGATEAEPLAEVVLPEHVAGREIESNDHPAECFVGRLALAGLGHLVLVIWSRS